MLKRACRAIYHRLPILRELLRIQGRLDNVCKVLKANQARHDANLTYLLHFDLRDHPRYGDPRRLLCYQLQVSSQNAEDGILYEIFRRIGSSTRVFAEVGVGDGRENNTAFLLALGWTGFWIDGDSSFLRTLDRDDLGSDCVTHVVALASKENIGALFEQLSVPHEFDLLSIDVDQNTYYIWEGLVDYRPRVVVVEYNAALPPDVDWKVRYDPSRTWNGTQNFGASLKALELLGHRLGYGLVGCDFNGVNAFFVRDDLLADHFVGPFSAENHYEPPRYSLVCRRSHPAAILDRPLAD